MEINLQDGGFLRRLLFKTGSLYVLIAFAFIEIIVFWGENITWKNIYNINLIFIPFVFIAFFRGYKYGRRYIYKLLIYENNIELYYKDYNTKKTLVLRIDDLYVVVKKNKLDLTKYTTHRIDFKSKSPYKKEGFELRFRQYEIEKWDFALMKRIEGEIMRIQYNSN